MRLGLSSLAVIAVLLSSSPSSAVPPPPMVWPPTPAEPTPLELAEQQIELDCQPRGDQLRCAFVLRYTIVNPTDQPITVSLRVPRIGYGPAVVELDGAAVTLELNRLELTVAPGGRRSLVGRGIMTGSRRHDWFVLPATLIRHPLAGGDNLRSPLFFIDVEVRSPRWAGQGPARVQARIPRAWRPKGDPGRIEAGRRVIDHTADPADRRSVFLSFTEPKSGWHLTNGGPFVDLGGTYGDGFRTRVGYEVGIHTKLLASVAAESNFDDTVILTPLIEAATPGLLFWPSMGAGLGLPIRVTPDPTVGGRLQLVASWPIGFVASFDYYPADNDWQTTLAGRLSL